MDDSETITLSDGARLATWTRAGPVDAPHVVLLHGGPGLWDYLAPLADLLEAEATTHRYDQRGCGASTASAEQSMARSVADLDELRGHWGLDRFVLIGHSFGATLALAYAAAHPDRLSVVGYVSGVGIGDWRTPFRAEKATRAEPFAARLADLAALQRTPTEEVEWRTLTWATDYADLALGLKAAGVMAQSPHTVNQHANRTLTFTDADQIGWAAAVRCPVYVVHGTADPRPAANALLLADQLSTARKRVVTEAGHLPWVEQPDQLRELLAEIVQAGRR
jgi:proline iminopeptidase